jgi:hypothetical protein
VLCEVGGGAAVYCPVGDVAAWVAAVGRLLDRPEEAPGRAERLGRAASYTWQAHACAVYGAYERLIGGES